MEFFNSEIAPELQINAPTSPIILADALKFTNIFRRQIPKEVYPQLMPLLVHHLGSDNDVISAYAAHAIERLLLLKDDAGQGKRPVLRYNSADITPFLQQIFGNGFKTLKMQLNKRKENEYVMRCLMRVINKAKESLQSYAGQLVQELTFAIGVICKNPINPAFNHFLFEALAAVISNLCAVNKGAVTQFEQLLFPPFQQVLVMDVEEFTPYVFQIMALMVEQRGPSDPLADSYKSMMPTLVSPALWERQGNIPALVRLMKAFLPRCDTTLLSSFLEPLLGVFQRLTSTNLNDHYGFELVEAIVQHTQTQQLSPFAKPILLHLFTRLNRHKTQKFMRHFVIFTSVFALKHGAQYFISTVDSIQQGMTVMIIQTIWLPTLQKVLGGLERTLCALGCIQLLGSPDMVTEAASQAWVALLQALIRLIELPEDDTDDDPDVEESPEFSAAYLPLAYATKEEALPYPPGTNPRQVLVQTLQQLGGSCPQVQQLVATQLGSDYKGPLQQYYASCNVPYPF